MGRSKARPGLHKATWALSPAGKSARGTCSVTNLRLVGPPKLRSYAVDSRALRQRTDNIYKSRSWTAHEHIKCYPHTSYQHCIQVGILMDADGCWGYEGFDQQTTKCCPLVVSG